MLRRSIVALLAAVSLASVSTAPATNVSGNIYTSTWTKANSPYRVVGAITVASGNTLTIQPGVEVLFDTYVDFRVNGAVVANGVEGDMVNFDIGTAAWWGGMDVYGSVTLSYTRLAHGNDSGGGAIYSPRALRRT